MSQNDISNYLGKTFQYRPYYDERIAAFFPAFNVGKVVQVILSLPELECCLSLGFSAKGILDDVEFYSLDELELLQLVEPAQHAAAA